MATHQFLKVLKEWEQYSIFVDFQGEALGRLNCNGTGVPVFYAILHICVQYFKHNEIEPSQISLDSIYQMAQFWKIDEADILSLAKSHPLFSGIKVQITKLKSQEKSTDSNSPN